MCKLEVTLETILKSRENSNKQRIKIKQLAKNKNYQSERNNGWN